MRKAEAPAALPAGGLWACGRSAGRRWPTQSFGQDPDAPPAPPAAHRAPPSTPAQAGTRNLILTSERMRGRKAKPGAHIFRRPRGAGDERQRLSPFPEDRLERIQRDFGCQLAVRCSQHRHLALHRLQQRERPSQSACGVLPGGQNSAPTTTWQRLPPSRLSKIHSRFFRKVPFNCRAMRPPRSRLRPRRRKCDCCRRGR